MFNVVKRSRSIRVGALLGSSGGGGGSNGGVGPAGVDGAHGPEPPYGPGLGLVSGPALLDASRPGLQNADISPVLFPGGRNPYLDRPLPPPPPPKNLAAPPPPSMPARPSTSSGPGSSKSSGSRPNFDKRLSRDDMFLPGVAGGARKKGLQPYRVGVKSGALPTPEPSPDNMPSYNMTSAIPARMPSPESMSSGEIQIGMALGSPTHLPGAIPPSWQQQPSIAAQEAVSPPPVQQTMTIQRQKTQRRKLFGLFGSRKNSEPAKLSSMSSEASGSTTTVSVTVSSNLPPSETSTPTRSNTVAGRKTPRYQPIIIRSNTEPRLESPVRETRGMKVRPSPSPSGMRPQADSADIWPSATSTAAPSLGGPSLLDVEIPDIRLERYSVMFSGLLNPQGQSTTSSLLARRQATLEKLKTINDQLSHDEDEKERLRQRRATSPQPTKSPGFTLFPPTPGRSETASQYSRKSPRSRSHTSPALLPSPSKATFELERQEAPRKEKKTVTIISPRTMDERNRAAQVERLREQQVKQSQQGQAQRQGEDSGFHFGPGESGLILDSPQSIGENDEVVGSHDSHPLRPKIVEPEWTMVTPPPSSSSSITTKRSPSLSTSASSIHTQASRPSTEVDEGEAALKAAVEISIARQISISRQQRQLLRPLQTNVSQMSAVRAKGVSPNSATAKASPIKKGSLGKDGRVAETKFSTPTLVVPRETLDSQLARNRKSEMVVLEG